jgi:hypothetical protein
MVNNSGDARGNRKLMLGGVIGAGVLFIGLIAWLLLGNLDGIGRGRVDQAAKQELTALPVQAAQRSGESTVGKSDPAGQVGAAGERQRAIKETAQPLSLSDEQRRQVSAAVADQPGLVRTDQAKFEMMIGTLVPPQIELSDIPPRVTEIANGYWGSQCIVVRDVLVVIDLRTRRIVALMPLTV